MFQCSIVHIPSNTCMVLEDKQETMEKEISSWDARIIHFCYGTDILSNLCLVLGIPFSLLHILVGIMSHLVIHNTFHITQIPLTLVWFFLRTLLYPFLLPFLVFVGSNPSYLDLILPSYCSCIFLFDFVFLPTRAKSSISFFIV